jgi:hypothetical protein
MSHDTVTLCAINSANSSSIYYIIYKIVCRRLFKEIKFLLKSKRIHWFILWKNATEILKLLRENETC